MPISLYTPGNTENVVHIAETEAGSYSKPQTNISALRTRRGSVSGHTLRGVVGIVTCASLGVGAQTVSASIVVHSSHGQNANLVNNTRQMTVLEQWQHQLNRLGNLEDDWDGDNAPCPNERSYISARTGLAALLHAGVEPHDILPSAEGGIAFTFESEKGYADIEFMNSGSILVGIDTEEARAAQEMPEVHKISIDHNIKQEIARYLIRIAQKLDLPHSSSSNVEILSR